jgi:hypothetical protein
MKYKIKQNSYVDAIQVQEDNLKAIQEFMFPYSPSRGTTFKKLGVWVKSDFKMLDIGDWIIKESEDEFRTFTDASFQNQYEITQDA